MEHDGERNSICDAGYLHQNKPSLLPNTLVCARHAGQTGSEGHHPTGSSLLPVDLAQPLHDSLQLLGRVEGLQAVCSDHVLNLGLQRCLDVCRGWAAVPSAEDDQMDSFVEHSVQAVVPSAEADQAYSFVGRLVQVAHQQNLTAGRAVVAEVAH